MKQAIEWIWTVLTAPIRFVAQALTESDGNGGKASYSRIAGTYVIYKIIELGGKDTGFMETMFWVLVGYQFLSKAMNSMSPAVLDIAKGMLLKIQSPPAPKTEGG